jgi:hypothetical protein
VSIKKTEGLEDFFVFLKKYFESRFFLLTHDKRKLLYRFGEGNLQTVLYLKFVAVLTP